MGWFERQYKRVLHASSATIIDADPSFGTAFLFEALTSNSPSFVWVRIDERDDAVSIGSKISRAVESAYGALLFGTGMPYSYALNYLVALSDELGPTCLLVDNANLNTGFCEAALLTARRARGRFRLVLAGSSDEADEWNDLVGKFTGNLVTDADMSLSHDEAETVLEALTDRPSASLLDRLGWRYEAILRHLAEAHDRPAPARPQPGGVGTAADREKNGLSQLVSLGLETPRMAQFESYVRDNPPRAVDMLPEIADSYFGQGRVLHLRVLLDRLMGELSPTPNLLYWWFQAHIAIGEQARAEARAAAVVRTDPASAPALAAAYASSVRPPDALNLVRGAVSSARIPETVAALGFLQVMNGKLADGIENLQEAFRGYLDRSQHHRAIQVGNSIGSAYVMLGDFERAAIWARRGLDDLRRFEIREELLRLSTTNLLAYSQLLMGDLAGAEESLTRVKVSSDGELPPTLEGLVSTMGDYEIAQGRADQALLHYGRIYSAYSSRLPGYAARHLVRALLHTGDLRRAKAVVQFADEVVAHSDVVERANLNVARFTLETLTEGVHADALRHILSTPTLRSDAVTQAEVALHAAHSYVTADALDDARAVLQASRTVLRALGRSGWQLLAPPGSDIDLLQQLTGIDSEIVPRLHVCGGAEFERDGKRTRISRRYAEIITVLAYSEQGLSGEALLLELYGDEGQKSSLKSTVSRARRYVRIDSTPYRLGERVRVDALQLDHHLANGDLQQALELYQGPLLPESEAPGIVRERERIDEALRQAVLFSEEPELILRLARKFEDDLDLWERAKELTPQDDPAYPLIRARVRRIRGEWGL